MKVPVQVQVEAAPVAGVPPMIAPSNLLSQSCLDPTSYMLPKKTRRRRKVHELDRTYECAFEGCERRYASESALHQHLWLKHQVKRCRNNSLDSISLDSPTNSRPAPYCIPSHSQRRPSSSLLSPTSVERQESGQGMPSPFTPLEPATSADNLRFTGRLSVETPGLPVLRTPGLEEPLFQSSPWNPPTPPAVPVLSQSISPLGSPTVPQLPRGGFALPEGKSSPWASLLGPRKKLTEQTDQELKAELRRLLAMFQTVETLESVVFRRPGPIGM